MDDSGNAGETPKKTKPLIPRIPEEDAEVVNVTIQGQRHHTQVPDQAPLPASRWRMTKGV
jgi:hypothetical protein